MGKSKLRWGVFFLSGLGFVGFIGKVGFRSDNPTNLYNPMNPIRRGEQTKEASNFTELLASAAAEANSELMRG